MISFYYRIGNALTWFEFVIIKACLGYWKEGTFGRYSNGTNLEHVSLQLPAPGTLCAPPQFPLPRLKGKQYFSFNRVQSF